MSILQKRIILLTLGVLLFIIAFGGIFFSIWAEKNIIQTTKHELLKSTKLAAYSLSVIPISKSTTSNEYASNAQKIADYLGSRVTIVLSDGKVVADTEFDYVRMSNHSDRLEIQRALQGIEYSSIRKSDTFDNERFIYAATPIIIDGQVIAVLRLAKSIEHLNRDLFQLKMALLFIAIIIFITILIMSRHFSRSILRPLNELERVANNFAKGDFDSHVSANVENDFKGLTDAFNEMTKDLKATVTELKNDRDRLSAIISNINDGLILADSNGVIKLVNPVAAKIFNTTIEYGIGKTLIEFTLSYELAGLFEHVKKNSLPATLDMEITGATNKYIDAYISQLSYGDLMIVLHDNTKQRLTDNIRRDFVANVSHELRTPLAIIKAMAETIFLRGNNDHEMVKTYSEKIASETDRLTAISDDLLNLSKIEEGTKKINKTNTNLNLFMNDIFNNFAEIAANKNINLINEIPTDMTVNIDQEILAQIAINLIDNAIKYNNKEDGYIKITAKNGDKVVMEFIDNGVGIEPNDLERIFERFYRVDKARSRSEKSTGLGLAIVKHLAHMHGGTISVTSTPDVITTFTVII